LRRIPPTERRVSLANIQIKEVTGFETAFEIKMRVFNANDVALNVKGIGAELEVNGQPFATGVSNTPVEIPAYGSELVTFTAYSSVLKMFKSVYGLKTSEELTYRLNGKIRVSAGSNMMPATLPFESNTFDAVVNTASVEYLTDPLAVFSEVSRVLRPDGYFIVTFSNRWFPTKAITVWRELHEFERMGLVLEYFLRAGGFKDLQTYSIRGLPRPHDDKYFPELMFSDPVYAVWGRKK